MWLQIFIVFIVIIILVIFISNYKKRYEGFQYLMVPTDNDKTGNQHNNPNMHRSWGVKAVEYIPVTKKNSLLETDVSSYDECFELCRTTPDCDGFNFFLEKCSLYTGLKNFVPTVAYYRKW